jgi:hypothetical protein
MVLIRGRRRFGERGSGVEEDAIGYLHPDPSFYRLTAGDGNSGPGVEFLAPGISGVSEWNFRGGRKFNVSAQISGENFCPMY